MKKGLSFNKWLWNNGISIVKEKKNFDPYFALYAKINSNWIIELNVESKTMKHLEKN